MSVLLVLPAGVAEATAPTTVPAIESIEWAPCLEDATAECGELKVPIDWSQPGGATMQLALARRKATDPARRIGSLLVNPGGPGGSGVNFAIRANRYFSPSVQAHFDVVGFDPRGVARSQPVVCSQEVLARQPSIYPRTAAEFDMLAAYNRELAADCRTQSGPIYDHANTLSVVRDVDAIREALGEERISFFGVSYGTLIGQQYAENFGHRIRALVLDSTMDHSLATRRFAVTQAATLEDSFHEFVKWCNTTPACALHKRDVPGFWDGLLEAADAGVVRDPRDPDPHRPIGSDELIDTAAGAFASVAWQTLADYLIGLQIVTQSSSASDVAVAPSPTVRFPFTAVFCQDWNMRVKTFHDFNRLTASEIRTAPHMRGSPNGHSYAYCAGLDNEADNPQHRLRIDPAAPNILILNALHDPATGFNWALNVYRQSAPKTVLVTYEGWGHGAYRRTDCTRGTTDAYLISLTVPPIGTRCPAALPALAAPRDAGNTGLPIGDPPAYPRWRE